MSIVTALWPARVRRGAAVAIFAVAALTFAVVGDAARADVPSPCSPPAGVSPVRVGARSADAVLSALRARIGPFALPGAPFNAGDVVDRSQTMWRLILIWRNGPTWLVAAEHGGRGYNIPLFVFEADSAGKLDLRTCETAQPQTFCIVARRLVPSH